MGKTREAKVKGDVENRILPLHFRYIKKSLGIQEGQAGFSFKAIFMNREKLNLNLPIQRTVKMCFCVANDVCLI